MSEISLHTLSYNRGSVKRKKRVGRGYGSGKGETAGKGNNGNKQRSGFKRKWGFEGGQTPLYKRMPIIHKTNNFAKKSKTVTLDMLTPIFNRGINVIGESELIDFGIIEKGDAYKIVCGKKCTGMKDVKICADGFSKNAKTFVETFGGKCLLNKQIKKNRNVK